MPASNAGRLHDRKQSRDAMIAFMAQAAAAAKRNRKKPQLILATICAGSGLDTIASGRVLRPQHQKSCMPAYGTHHSFVKNSLSGLLSQGLQAAVLALIAEPGGLEDAADLLVVAAKNDASINYGAVVNILLQHHLKAGQPYRAIEVALRLCAAARKNPAQLVRSGRFMTCCTSCCHIHSVQTDRHMY
jgi:hypothetical protein